MDARDKASIQLDITRTLGVCQADPRLSRAVPVLVELLATLADGFDPTTDSNAAWFNDKIDDAMGVLINVLHKQQSQSRPEVSLEPATDFKEEMKFAAWTLALGFIHSVVLPETVPDDLYAPAELYGVNVDMNISDFEQLQPAWLPRHMRTTMRSGYFDAADVTYSNMPRRVAVGAPADKLGRGAAPPRIKVSGSSGTGSDGGARWFGGVNITSELYNKITTLSKEAFAAVSRYFTRAFVQNKGMVAFGVAVALLKFIDIDGVAEFIDNEGLRDMLTNGIFDTTTFKGLASFAWSLLLVVRNTTLTDVLGYGYDITTSLLNYMGEEVVDIWNMGVYNIWQNMNGPVFAQCVFTAANVFHHANPVLSLTMAALASFNGSLALGVAAIPLVLDVGPVLAQRVPGLRGRTRRSKRDQSRMPNARAWYGRLWNEIFQLPQKPDGDMISPTDRINPRLQLSKLGQVLDVLMETGRKASGVSAFATMIDTMNQGTGVVHAGLEAANRQRAAIMVDRELGGVHVSSVHARDAMADALIDSDIGLQLPIEDGKQARALLATMQLEQSAADARAMIYSLKHTMAEDADPELVRILEGLRAGHEHPEDWYQLAGLAQMSSVAHVRPPIFGSSARAFVDITAPADYNLAWHGVKSMARGAATTVLPRVMTTALGLAAPPILTAAAGPAMAVAGSFLMTDTLSLAYLASQGVIGQAMTKIAAAAIPDKLPTLDIDAFAFALRRSESWSRSNLGMMLLARQIFGGDMFLKRFGNWFDQINWYIQTIDLVVRHFLGPESRWDATRYMAQAGDVTVWAISVQMDILRALVAKLTEPEFAADVRAANIQPELDAIISQLDGPLHNVQSTLSIKNVLADQGIEYVAALKDKLAMWDAQTDQPSVATTHMERLARVITGGDPSDAAISSYMDAAQHRADDVGNIFNAVLATADVFNGNTPLLQKDFVRFYQAWEIEDRQIKLAALPTTGTRVMMATAAAYELKYVVPFTLLFRFMGWNEPPATDEPTFGTEDTHSYIGSAISSQWPTSATFEQIVLGEKQPYGELWLGDWFNGNADLQVGTQTIPALTTIPERKFATRLLTSMILSGRSGPTAHGISDPDFAAPGFPRIVTKQTQLLKELTADYVQQSMGDIDMSEDDMLEGLKKIADAYEHRQKPRVVAQLKKTGMLFALASTIGNAEAYFNSEILRLTVLYEELNDEVGRPSSSTVRPVLTKYRESMSDPEALTTAMRALYLAGDNAALTEDLRIRTEVVAAGLSLVFVASGYRVFQADSASWLYTAGELLVMNTAGIVASSAAAGFHPALKALVNKQAVARHRAARWVQAQYIQLRIAFYRIMRNVAKAGAFLTRAPGQGLLSPFISGGFRLGAFYYFSQNLPSLMQPGLIQYLPVMTTILLRYVAKWIVRNVFWSVMLNRAEWLLRQGDDKWFGHIGWATMNLLTWRVVVGSRLTEMLAFGEIQTLREAIGIQLSQQSEPPAFDKVAMQTVVQRVATSVGVRRDATFNLLHDYVRGAKDGVSLDLMDRIIADVERYPTSNDPVFADVKSPPFRAMLAKFHDVILRAEFTTEVAKQATAMLKGFSKAYLLSFKAFATQVSGDVRAPDFTDGYLAQTLRAAVPLDATTSGTFKRPGAVPLGANEDEDTKQTLPPRGAQKRTRTALDNIVMDGDTRQFAKLAKTTQLTDSLDYALGGVDVASIVKFGLVIVNDIDFC